MCKCILLSSMKTFALHTSGPNSGDTVVSVGRDATERSGRQV